MSDPVVPLEVTRMFLGEQEALFYLEILVRTLVIYIYTFVLLRLFGRRTKASMSIMDVIVIVALGSAVGDVAFYPKVPILHCLLVITLIVGFNKLLIEVSQRSHKIRDIIEGDATTIIKGGVIQLAALQSTSVGRQALLEMLRVKGVCNLSQVSLCVLEPSCEISIFRAESASAGLSILPPDPAEDTTEQRTDTNTLCCANCGSLEIANSSPCPTNGCGSSEKASIEAPRYGS